MKTKNNIIYLIIALFAIVPSVMAQNASFNGINITEPAATKQHDQVSVSFNITLDGLKVKSNNMVVLTPVLTSNDNGADQVSLPPVVVSGKKRHKIIRRKQVLGEPLVWEQEPEVSIVRKNKNTQQITYSVAVPYSEWMSNASLLLQQEVSGCADCISPEGELLLVSNLFPAPYEPVYKLTYVMPEAEAKVRSDRHTATFNFVINRWELLRDYKGNAPKFDEVDQIVKEIKDNSDLNITEFGIDGYASPEGAFPHNKMLAQNRANAFADYLVSKFNIDRKLFTVAGHGEDWEGLRKAVAASSLKDRDAVLDIIDRVSNPDARDAELKKLSAGETYRTLLTDYYPALRRTEYVVAYSVRAFDVEEAKQVIKSNPRLLSLNEMYLVAQSYPAGSKEFKEVFDIAVRLYPDSDIAILNSASADIESGNMNGAIDRLTKIADSPKVWNNLGVAYARKGDTAKAKEYFTKAAAQNDADARINLEELRKTVEQ